MTDERKMSLETACLVLSRVHTRDDDVTGFQIIMGARVEQWDVEDYTQAWRVVREHARLQTAPPEQEDKT